MSDLRSLRKGSPEVSTWGKKRETLLSQLPIVKGGAMGIKLPYVSRFPTCEHWECQEKVLSGCICMKLVEARMEPATWEQSAIKEYLPLLKISGRI